jgi:GT2 family glycosyltransferase
MVSVKTHIVIPCYNHYELTNQLLFSLYQREVQNIDSVLVVDDSSTDEEVLAGLRWWGKQGILPLSSLSLSVNKGFLRTAKEGMKLVTSRQDRTDLLILMSNDVKIQGKFVSQIQDIVTNNPKSLVGGILYTQDTGWNKFGNKIFPYLEGWLLATTIGNWKELEYFDDCYSPCDFEDVDLSTTALSRGYELVPLNNPALVHMGGGTIGYNPEREKQTKINQKKFEEKWLK